VSPISVDNSGLPSRISALPNAQPAAQSVRLRRVVVGNFWCFLSVTKLPRLRPHPVHTSCARNQPGYPQQAVDNFSLDSSRSGMR
jgi:hypothetical protein